MELTLFVIVGALAIVAAAMMLISENAVYSALFLILNFAAIAFFFLMLNAPFLAMVQIVVYAGAIMVLFLFVIMLLGAERVEHTSPTRFRWLGPVAVLLAVIFLITASVAILGGEIDLTAPQKATPYIRVVNAFDDRAAGDAGSVDVYLNGELFADGVVFGTGTKLDELDAGAYTVTVFDGGADPASDNPLVEQQVEVNDGEVISLVTIGRAAGNPGPGLAVATYDVQYNDDKDTLWLQVVNALPDWDRVALREAGARDALIDELAYGEATVVTVGKGEYDLILSPAGDERSHLVTVNDTELEANHLTLLVFSERWLEGNAFAQHVIQLDAKAPASFGSPTHIGRLLFSHYVLPFEMVSLLLLVAMIGAIVLTHEALGRRRRVVRRLANPPAGLEQPVAGEPGNEINTTV